MRNASLQQDFREASSASAAWEARGRAVMPIASSRAIAFHDPYPLTVTRAEGSFLWDADGARYIDLASNMYSLVHGNAFPPIVQAAAAQLARGSAWPANNTAQIELAETLVARLPAVERVLFCNSGTEAFSLALNIARGQTGRHRFLMAQGGYHGTMWDTNLGGRGAPGPVHLAAPYGDTAAFLSLIEQHGEEIAAVFLEPVLGSGGFALPPPGFLREVHAACGRKGIVFVLDEVISFRLAPGGAQSRLDFTPDLVMLGKVIGGGFPVGGVGGRAELLAVVDPAAPRALASGTFSGNPVTMAAGLASVQALTPGAIAHIDRLAQLLEAGLQAEAAARSVPLFTRRVGSMLGLFFYDPGAGAVATATRPDAAFTQELHLAMLLEGLFPLPRCAMTTTTVMTAPLIAEVVQRFGRALARVGSMVPLPA
ncbi:aminotransferase class III-fold pyridoxal phosphate-dependent enzyme [Roseomonas sp. USHLN139]|uniref:aminotransferase class III-fold pyridoxal phosphate-dependent enzyme n=1 Tax=Roseomonas sp. USHLN139 TaxID=3081298 RepID=UPI003B02EA19